MTVGFRDYVRAANEQAKAALAEYAESDSEGSRRLQGALATATELKNELLAKTDEHLATFAQTPQGQKTVKFVERAQQEVAQLPGITVIADASRSMHGVTALALRVVEQPDDPWSHLWLAEALVKMKRTQRATAAARAVVEPSSLLTKTAVSGINRLGSAGTPLEERLLRRSYVLTCQALAAGVSGEMLHVLGRIYRASDRPAEAAVALQPALLLAGEHAGLAHVTSARLHYEARRLTDARRDAQAALTLGCTLGNEVLADLVSAQASGGLRARAEAVQEAAEFRGQVSRTDLVSYYGTYSTTGEAISEMAAAQKDKVTATADRVRTAGSGWSVPPQRTENEG